MSNIKQIFQTRQSMQKNGLESFYYSDPSPIDVPFHQHSFYEVYVFLQGSLTYIVGGSYYHLMPGDILIIPPMVLHRPIFDEPRGQYERMVIWFDNDYISSLSSEQTDLSECLSPFIHSGSVFIPADWAATTVIRYQIHQLNSTFQTREFGWDVQCKSFLTQILLNIRETITDETHFTSDRTNSNPIVDKTLDYIQEHLTENLTLEEISANNFTSKYYLSHVFRSQLGVSIYQYILARRLCLAKQLITEGMPISKVYSSCGFNSYSNFFRVFKSYFGITPKEYYRIMGGLGQ